MLLSWHLVVAAACDEPRKKFCKESRRQMGASPSADSAIPGSIMQFADTTFSLLSESVVAAVLYIVYDFFFVQKFHGACNSVCSRWLEEEVNNVSRTTNCYVQAAYS